MALQSGELDQFGLSARALAVNVEGDTEEFPFLREFWVELPEKKDVALAYRLVET